MNKVNVLRNKLKGTRLAEDYRSLRKYIKNKYYRTLSDEEFLKKTYKKVFGRELNTNNPISLNEKLQWLKLYWYDSRAEICADKYAVRDYIESCGLGHLLNELIAVYDKVEDIDYNKLPDKFVLKCTHGSSCNIICKNKDELDWDDAKNKLREWLGTNYYWFSREWIYRNIKPRIVCEEFLEDEVTGEIEDYKFFCFNGIPCVIMLCTERFSDTGLKVDFYDTKWLKLNLKQGGHPNSSKERTMPANFSSMLMYARQLSKEFPIVRVDFNEVNGRLYFGELTFFDGGGFEKYEPERYDFEFGAMITLPTGKK